MGGMGKPPGGRVGLLAHAHLLALRQRDGAEPGRLAAHLSGPLRHGGPQRSTRGLLGARQRGGQAACRVPDQPGAAQDRAGRRPRRALGALRRLEGGGPGLRLPPGRPGAGRRKLSRHRAPTGPRHPDAGARPEPLFPDVVEVVDVGVVEVPPAWKLSVNGAWLPGGSCNGEPLTLAVKTAGAPAMTETGPLAAMVWDWPEKTVA